MKVVIHAAPTGPIYITIKHYNTRCPAHKFRLFRNYYTQFRLKFSPYFSPTKYIPGLIKKALEGGEGAKRVRGTEGVGKALRLEYVPEKRKIVQMRIREKENV